MFGTGIEGRGTEDAGTAPAQRTTRTGQRQKVRERRKEGREGGGREKWKEK